MLSERGVVSAVNNHRVTVACRSKIDCIRCAEGKGCGGGILARWLGNRQYSVDAYYDPSIQSPKVGEFVSIALPANRVIKLAALMYASPLILMLLVLVLQVLIFPNAPELLVILLAFVALLSGFYLVRKFVNKANLNGSLLPRLSSENPQSLHLTSACKSQEQSL